MEAQPATVLRRAKVLLLLHATILILTTLVMAQSCAESVTHHPKGSIAGLA